MSSRDADIAAGSDTLRAAAEQMRRDWPLCPNRDTCACEDEPVMADYHHDSDFHNAVADWLDAEARAFDDHMDRQMDPLRRFHTLWLASARERHEHALTVAHAYGGRRIPPVQEDQCNS